jgi:hypothetical protein
VHNLHASISQGTTHFERFTRNQIIQKENKE